MRACQLNCARASEPSRVGGCRSTVPHTSRPEGHGGTLAVMATTLTTCLPALALAATLCLPACADDAERPTIHVDAIEPYPLPPEIRPPGAPGIGVTPKPVPSFDAGTSAPQPPEPSVDAGFDAGSARPPLLDPPMFDASLIPAATAP